MTPSSLRTHAERLLLRVGGAAAILMYHRVAEEHHDPWDLCVSPRRFAEQLAFLCSATQCVELLEVQGGVGLRRRGKLRVAVTFDDGYRDNLTQALPILERYQVPATVFVVSGTIGRSREFWWDALERCLLRPLRLPERLALEITGVRHVWHLQDQADPLPRWRADRDSVPGFRQALFLTLWRALVVLGPEQQDAVLNELMCWAGVDREPPPDRRPLTLHELRELSSHPLIRIGCHTENHRSLPGLSTAEQRREIEAGQSALERMTGASASTFSFPYGRYDETTAALVRGSSFELACASNPDVVSSFSSRWTLPRLQPTDLGGPEFASWLCGCVPGLRAPRFES